ncbi:transcriptional regulator ATRX-like isoform X2 [Lucilia cuprina]|uniref:transcriptional regulator ATRX-like isoform X2 n=1 Tax=Lucilia cuprina TaxID=7375 RepID=UPI001F06CB2E|nr:transcriptional regulator ATRX-like isoform X2 [Lucilia cuprina]
MDKEQETLDMVLDIPNTISLNPFDRPPNIMDDELNSVTQEELEANLSTDCPTGTMDTAPAQNCNDMWEKLIQSFLEDNSTQDAVVQSVNTNPSMFETEAESENREKVETAEEPAKAEIQEALTVVLEEKPSKNNEIKEEENIESEQEKKIAEIDSNVYKLEPELDIPAETYMPQDDATVSDPEEHLMNDSNEEQQMLTCLYDLQDDDVQNDLCQVEVYATEHETDASSLKKEQNIEGDCYENDEDDDCLSNVSAISIGYLEPIDDKQKCKIEILNEKERLNETKLSTIINDHCYSQEVSINMDECDVLKQNVINHIMTQNISNKNHHKIANFVDKILNSLDNNKLDLMMNTLNATEQPQEFNVKIENETSSDALSNKSEEVNIQLENESGSNSDSQIEQEEQQVPKDNELITETNLQEEQTVNLEKEVIQITPNKEAEETNEPAREDNEEILGEIALNDQQQSQTETDIPETNETNEENRTTESEEAKSLCETLAYNCSEALEHQIFDEEFEMLCKNGVLPLKEKIVKTDAHSELLEKLKEFAIQMQKDCEDFSSSSIENKLHDYIIMQCQNFQELFKPYVVFKQSIETQTKSKKLTKRKRKLRTANSKNNLSKTSDQSSSRYSSTSSSDEAEDNVKTKYIDTDEEPKQIKSPPSLSSNADYFHSNATNYGQEYDDGINLSQYVQSEIFNIDSLSPQSTMLSDSDSAKDDNEENDSSPIINKAETSHPDKDDDDTGDSDDTMIYKVRSKKSKSSNDSASVTSPSEAAKSNKSQADNMSVHSESDKENLTSERKEKKSNESMDEDEKNDREIDRLTNISGLTKRTIPNASSSKGSDKGKTKTAPAKTLNDRFDFMDVEFGSEDEVKSEAEEEVITEQQFLRNCNEDIKRQMLDDSSTDSEALEEEDDELLKASSEEDEEGGTKSPLVEKFLKTFKVDDSDNDIEDNDDDDDDELDLDSDKEEEEKNKENEENKNNNELLAEADKPVKTEDNGIDEETHTNAEMELLNDNFRIRNYTKPQNLDKMLLEAEKRKKISKIDAELISLSSDSSNSDVEAVDVEPSQKPRSLKPMLRPDQLAGETIKAQKLENERISRLEKKHNMLEKILKEHPEVDKDRELILDYIKETKTFIKVHPGIVKNLKPHQFDGVRFMYDSCYGGVDALKKSPGSGCILAHCMGLGKTLQLISLLHTVISYKELKTTKILVLCPKSTVMNWADEIIRWLGPLRQKNVKVYTFSDTSDINEKLSIIKEWSLSNHARAGCLLIGYEAFRTLVFYHSYKNRGNINSERLEEIRLLVNRYLLTPGADLVVCDEGHIIKNSNSAISKAVAKIETPRRIVLTGTPIQNNLKEYYSMVNFIKPLFLGTEKEFANLYANPIKNGQHKDSGKMDIKIMKQRSFVLHKKLSKFVQRKEAELLKTFLPTKFEYVLFIPMTDVQNNLYQHILNAIKNRDENYRGKGLITDYTCLRKIWTHPKVLEDAWKNAISQRNKKENRNKLLGHNSDDDQPDDIYDSQTGQMSVTNDWWRHLVTENDLESVMPSNKLRTMFKILQMCEEKGEKCLIFSAFVAVLNVVEYFFKKISDNDAQIINELKINRNSKWILGHDYYRLDGKTPKSIRHAMINEFNNVENKTARVFLISAKAGGQGINLIGANRVIILDTSWNPSNDQQNIFRVFRLGQKRSCYIYRLLAMGTMEEKVYSRSVTKQAMSFRVVDEQQIDRHYNMAELAELYTLTIPDNNNRPTPILPQDSILARLLRTFPELVFKYHEHDSLLENKVEQELSEQEKNEAWTAYERDLQMNSEIREMPNIEDLQNKFNASNLSNYLSPFSGLDMSHLLNYNRGFGPNFLQSLLGQNTNAAALNTQQYIDVYNYYKNLGTAYADMNPYSTLPGLNAAGGPGRMPNASTPSSVSANPLAALGDLSMFGLSSTALQTLGANAAALNLPSSLGNSSSAALQQMTNSASMYTSPLNTNLPITSASNMSTGGVASASNSAAVLSAFEQYKQSFRGTYNNMYNYTGDFGLSSSGSTILDSSKSKNSKHGSGANNKNLPGGSKAGSNMGLFSGPPPYMPSPQPQPPAQQQLAQQQRPSSRNTPTYEPQQQQQQQPQQQQKSKSTISTTKSSSSSPSTSNSTLMTSPEANSSARAKSLLSYRRAESTSSSNTTSQSAANANSLSSNTKQSGENLTQNKQNSTVQQKKSTAEEVGSNANKTMPTPNAKTMKTPAGTTHVLSTNQKSNQKSTTNLGSNSSGSSTTSTTSSTSNKSTASAQSDSNRAMNMGILYPNSKGIDKNTNKPNSPLNMGIVYPKSSSKSTSEMQIIPTSSPPGTISISKQLNELSPSISLTALKTNPPNKTQTNQNIKTGNSQNAQINKIMQNNSNLRRTTSPVNSASVKTTTANLNTSTAAAVANAATNQSNLLARIKMANSKKPVNGSNTNNPVPPLHRASTMVNIPSTSTATKSSTGLTITNVKTAMKNPNMATKSLTTTSQISTLAKQNAAAVVKSNITRLSSAGGNNSNSSDNTSNQKNANTANNSANVPSLATFKRVVKRNSPNVNTAGNKMPALTSSPSLTVTSSNKLPIISSVKSISQYPSTMATISKASITKINTPTTQSTNSITLTKQSTSTTLGNNNSNNNQPSVSKTLAQMQKRLPTTTQTATTSAASTSANAVNAIRNTVNIRPVDTKQNPAGTGGVYIIETNINDKKLAIGAPTKSGGGTTVTKVPTQTAIKRKSTDPLSKDKTIETKRLKQ